MDTVECQQLLSQHLPNPKRRGPLLIVWDMAQDTLRLGKLDQLRREAIAKIA